MRDEELPRPPTLTEKIAQQESGAESLELFEQESAEIVEPEESGNFYGLSDDTFNVIITAVHNEHWLKVETEIFDLEPADIADLLEKASRDDALEIVRHLHGVLDSETYTHIGYERLKKLLSALGPRDIAAIIAELDTDDAISLLEDMDEDERKEILRHVNTRSRALVEEGLNFPEDSAGRMMQRDAVAIPQFWTVGKAIDYLRALGDELPEQLYDLFVVDPRHRVVGQIPAGQMLRMARGRKISDLIDDEPHIVPAHTDQEDVAALFKRVTMTSVAVVDDAERLIGVITVDDVVSVVDEEASEDLLRLGGVENDDLTQTTLGTAWSRFRWLFVNLLTAILASWVVSNFEETLEEIVALAILMPIVAGMGGNAGTQALTVSVRALATKELSAANYVRVTLKETMVGLMNGSVFASMVGLISGLWFHNLKLGIVIGSAMLLNFIMAGLAGTLIPIMLNRLKVDPAISSGVFLTAMTDIVGFASFLGLATLFLLG